MKDTEFVVNAFRKGMSIEEMNGFAHGLSAQYTEGFAHHEGFDAGDLAIVVMKRDVDVQACSAPDSQSVTETLSRALQQANQTIEYLRNEIDVLRKGSDSMMTVEDAKTLANVAYNRAMNVPTDDPQKDFEMWWAIYRNENGFAAEPKAERIYNQSSQDVYAQLYVLGQEYLGWHDLAKQVSKKDSDFNKFWTRMQEIYGDGCVSAKCVDAINRGTEQGFSRADYLKLIADEIVANQGRGQAEPTPTDPLFEGIMSELKDIARGALGWSDFENAPTPDGNFDAFWTAVEKRYDSVPSGESIYIKGTQLEYLESIAKAIIVLNAKDLPTKGKPKSDGITSGEVLPRIKALAAKFFEWSNHGMGGLVLENDETRQWFLGAVFDEYELELDIESISNGINVINITRLQYLEKVAKAVAEALNTQP